MKSPRSDRRVAIVTGANHGIGAATAAALGLRGVDVLVTYLRLDDETDDEYGRQRAQDGAAVVARIEAGGGHCVAIEADLADADAPRRLFDAAERELGPVEILVHNASAWHQDSFADGARGATDVVGRPNQPITTTSIDRQFEVDARAGALLMAEFIERHRRRRGTRGRIVTLTSGDGGAFPGEVSYGAAKAALTSYTLSAAAEMARDGVTANVVYPPVTDTGWITDDVREFVERDDDHHVVATPDEVAEVIAWLCVDAGRTVTGNVIRLR